MKKTAGSAGSSPSPALLSLVQSFLSNHGLTSTKKAFSREIQRKSKSSNWAHPPEVASLDGVSLEDVFDSYTEAQTHITQSNIYDDASSSDSTSSSISDNSDSEEEAPVKMNSKLNKTKNKRREASPSGSSSSESSSTSSSSDSDADDESEEELKTPKASVRASHANTLKRKAESSSIDDSSSESDSASDSSSSQDRQPAKRVKIAALSESSSDDSSSSDESSDDSDAEMIDGEALGAQLIESSADSSDDSSDSASDSDDSSVDAESAEDEGTKLANGIEAGSDSSGTVVGDKQESDRSGSLSDESLKDEIQVVEVKGEFSVKKHIGARPTPLAQLSAFATDDSHISNQYISYEYADKAFRDLSVTRGKGFTKEKNKKKRGSYRGGAIDISGGKAFKFED